LTLTYLIDTDWIIDHFNQVGRTTEKLKELRPAGITMSVVSLAELYEGIFYSRERLAKVSYLIFSVIPAKAGIQ